MKWVCGSKILSVEPTEKGTLVMKWSDDSMRVFDPMPRLKGDFMDRLRDPGYFKKVRITEFGDVVEWPAGQDFAPESLYENSVLLSAAE